MEHETNFGEILSSSFFNTSTELCEFLRKTGEKFKRDENKFLSLLDTPTNRELVFGGKQTWNKVMDENDPGLLSGDIAQHETQCAILKTFYTKNQRNSRSKLLPYNHESIVSLVELIRDKYVHLGNMPEQSLKKLGWAKDDNTMFIQFWIQRFPNLLPLLWMHKHKLEDIETSINPPISEIGLSGTMNQLNAELELNIMKGGLTCRYNIKTDNSKIVTLEFRKIQENILLPEESSIIAISVDNIQMKFIWNNDNNSSIIKYITYNYASGTNLIGSLLIFPAENDNLQIDSMKGLVLTHNRILVFIDNDEFVDEFVKNLEKIFVDKEFEEMPVTWKDLPQWQKVISEKHVLLQNQCLPLKQFIPKTDDEASKLLSVLNGPELNDFLREEKPELFSSCSSFFKSRNETKDLDLNNFTNNLLDYEIPETLQQEQVYVGRQLKKRVELGSIIFEEELRNDIFVVCGFRAKELNLRTLFWKTLFGKTLFGKTLFGKTLFGQTLFGNINRVTSIPGDEMSGLTFPDTCSNCKIFTTGIILEEYQEIVESIKSKSWYNAENIHFLCFQKENKFIWQATEGNLSIFLRQGKLLSDFELMDEIHLLENIVPSEPIIFLCDRPGIGKSTALKSFCKQIVAKSFTNLIISPEVDDFFDQIEDVELSKETLQSTILNLSTLSEFEKNILDKCLSEEHATLRISLIVDGLDEVDTTKQEQIIKALKQITILLPTLKIWVGLRIHMLESVRKEFPTASLFGLEPFSKTEQIQFLAYNWMVYASQNVDVDAGEILPESENIQAFAIKCVELKIENKNINIGNVPLQCDMIAKIYEEKVAKREFDMDLISEHTLHGLYDSCIERYFEIYLNKVGCVLLKPGSYLSIKLYRDMIYLHTYYALKLLISEEIADWYKQQTPTRFKTTDEYKNDVLDYGILVALEPPKFVHRTFAEFLVADFICDVLCTDIYDDEISPEYEAFQEIENHVRAVSFGWGNWWPKIKNPRLLKFINSRLDDESYKTNRILWNFCLPVIAFLFLIAAMCFDKWKKTRQWDQGQNQPEASED